MRHRVTESRSVSAEVVTETRVARSYAVREIGRQLQAERESRGLTLEAIAERTKIRRRLLQALEEGDVSLLEDEAYTKGFIRCYARELGLGPETWLARYQALQETKANPDPNENPASDERPGRAGWLRVLRRHHRAQRLGRSAHRVC